MVFTGPDFLDLSRAANWRTGPLEEFLDFIDLDDVPGPILEPGCGTGFFTRLLAEREPRRLLIGVDRDRRGLRTGVPARLVCADAARLPLPDGCLSGIVSHFFFVDCPHPERMLSELIRVAAPGGVITSLEPVYQVDLLNTYYPGVEPAELESLSAIFRKVLVTGPAAHGIDRAIAPRLPALFSASGLTDVGVRVTAGCSFSAALDPDALRQQQELAREGLAARDRVAERAREHPLLAGLTDSEFELLVSVQLRALEQIARDPGAYRASGAFTSMSFVLVRGRKA